MSITGRLCIRLLLVWVALGGKGNIKVTDYEPLSKTLFIGDIVIYSKFLYALLTYDVAEYLCSHCNKEPSVMIFHIALFTYDMFGMNFTGNDGWVRHYVISADLQKIREEQIRFQHTSHITHIRVIDSAS